MMKKLLLLCSAIFALNFVGQSQVEDTLRYFLKKQKYKAPIPPANTQHPWYKSAAGTIINTAFTHVGSIFKNRSPVAVVGLEARVMRPGFVISQNGNVPTRMYLANVVNGLPVFPLLDSTNLLITNESINNDGQMIGGNLAHGTQTLTGDFAVLIRCTSLLEGDTILVFRTNGHHANSTTAPSNDYKFGDGLGVVRYQGQFASTRDFQHPYFGLGTDYEFCVAPRVKYDLQISQAESPIQYGACCWQPFTNTNTSTYAWTSPQFNYTQFFRHLKPMNTNFPTTFVEDTALIWNVGDGSPNVLPQPFSDLVPLGFFGGDCNKFHYGRITGNFKKMAPDNPETTYTAQISFTSSTVWCNDTVGTGIKEYNNLENVKVYPNPVADKTTISGLKGQNVILVYNMVGQLILSQQTDKEEVSVDFSKYAIGSYLVRITNSENKSRNVKIIKQ